MYSGLRNNKVDTDAAQRFDVRCCNLLQGFRNTAVLKLCNSYQFFVSVRKGKEGMYDYKNVETNVLGKYLNLW